MYHFLRNKILPRRWPENDKRSSTIPGPEKHTLATLEIQGLVIKPTEAENVVMDTMWQEMKDEELHNLRFKNGGGV